MAWPLIAAAAIGAAGSIIGGRSSSKSSKAAANATRDSAQISADAQLQMYNQSRYDTAGQRQLFNEALPYLRGMAFGQGGNPVSYNRGVPGGGAEWQAANPAAPKMGAGGYGYRGGYVDENGLNHAGNEPGMVYASSAPSGGNTRGGGLVNRGEIPNAMLRYNSMSGGDKPSNGGLPGAMLRYGRVIRGEEPGGPVSGSVYNAMQGIRIPTDAAIPMTQNAEGQYINQMAGLNPAAGMPNIPGLRSRVDLDLENDPIYQAQRDEMTKQLNRRYAASGQYQSSDADNAMVRNVLPFMQDSYSRSLDELNRGNQNALTTYGLGYQRQGDIYGRNTSRLMDLYNMQSNLGDRQYGRVLDMAKIGSGAATTAGQNAMATGQGLASTYMNQGNTLANIASQNGQNQAQMWGNIAATGQGALNNYMLYNQMQNRQPTVQTANF